MLVFGGGGVYGLTSDSLLKDRMTIPQICGLYLTPGACGRGERLGQHEHSRARLPRRGQGASASGGRMSGWSVGDFWLVGLSLT